MECETASGLMPWLLNGTLQPAEAEALRLHLASCARCREEMDETRRAAEVFGAHPTADAILDLAWDRPVGDAALVRRHVESCAECGEDLALARESRRGEEPARASRSGVLRWVGLPAAMAAGLVLGLAWPRPQPPAPGPDPKVARLETEAAELRRSMSALAAELESSRAPEPNLPVFELVAPAVTRGAAGPPPTDLTVPKGVRQVALLLVADAPPGAPASLEVRAGAGGAVWRVEGLRPNPLGAYTVGLPVGRLAEGDLLLTLKPRGAAATVYRARVRRAP